KAAVGLADLGRKVVGEARLGTVEPAQAPGDDDAEIAQLGEVELLAAVRTRERQARGLARRVRRRDLVDPVVEIPDLVQPEPDVPVAITAWHAGMAPDGEDDPSTCPDELERQLLTARTGADDEDAARWQVFCSPIAARMELDELCGRLHRRG